MIDASSPSVLGLLHSYLHGAFPGEEEAIKNAMLRAFADATAQCPAKLRKGKDYRHLLHELHEFYGDSLPLSEQPTEPAVPRKSERRLRAAHIDPIHLLVRYLFQSLALWAMDEAEVAAAMNNMMAALDKVHQRCEASALMCKWIAHTKFDHGMYAFEPDFDVASLDPAMIAKIHESQWLKGQAPSIEQIKLVLTSNNFVNFVVTDRSSGTPVPIVVMHGASVKRNESIRAGDILHDGDEIARAVPDQPVNGQTLVFFAISSTNNIAGAHLAQWAIADQIIPWTKSNREHGHKRILTSSPMTYWPSVVRKIVNGAHRQQFKALIELVDKRVEECALGGYSGLVPLLRTAYPHMRRTDNLPRGLRLADADDPVYFMAQLFSWFPTHEEIFKTTETEKAHRVRVISFFTLPEDGHDPEMAVREREAAILLLLMCAVVSQAGAFDTETGAILDRIARFHLANGARYAPMLPLMGSRPRDLAAWCIGQILEYTDDWAMERNLYIAETETRRAEWVALSAGGTLDMKDWRITEGSGEEVGKEHAPTVGIDLRVATEFLVDKFEAIAGLAPRLARSNR